ncbi:MAG: acetate--CoA ligase family protein, partial [Burkholderiales bacterium]
FKDSALALPPLNTTLARQLIRETTISHAPKGVRGRKAIDKDVLAALLVRFSELVAEQPRIAEIDINPLLVRARGAGVVAADALIVLR